MVRNDGIRQLLLIPAVLAGLVIGAMVLFVVPQWLTPVAWVLIATLGIVPLVLVPKPVKAEQAEVSLPLFTPDPDNDKVIMVRGWGEDELRTILEGFALENFPTPTPRLIELTPEHELCFRLTFPEDIRPSEFTALVNYLLYPLDMEIRDHIITVAGRATLNSAFADIPDTLIGQKAIVYVPENDQDYDVVYMQTESGANLTYSFPEPGWRTVKRARLSDEARQLIEA